MRLLRVCRCSLAFRRTCAPSPNLTVSCHAVVLQKRNVSASTSLLVRQHRTHRPRQIEDDDSFKVNYFNEEVMPDGSRRRTPRLKEDVEEEDAEDEDIEATLEELEEESKGLSFGVPTEMTEEDAAQLFTKEELAKIRASNEGLDMNEDDGSLAKMANQRIPAPEDISPANRIFLDRLNLYMARMSLSPKSTNARKAVWRYYQRCKSNISGFLKSIPDNAWQLLWVSLGEDSPSNPDRASHLKILSQDMAYIGRTMTDEQRFAEIEGLFLEGKQKAALEKWELGLKNGDAGRAKFLDMGVRMYANYGDVQRAEDLLDVLFKLHRDWDPRVILPVIKCCAMKGDLPYIERAWALYLRFQNRLSTDMTMEDYDLISLSFLSADRKDLALAVFRDMMLSGDSTREKSSDFYDFAVQSLGQFMSLSQDAKEVNKLSLESLTFLPRRFENKFFYASWLKKLIGMQEIDAAAKVIELMYERNARPDAKHLNGLIGAWIRSGSKGNQRRAEALAWAMIQQRLALVRKREIRNFPDRQSPEISVYESKEGLDIPRPTSKIRSYAAATIETFSILVQYYLRREKFAHVGHVRDNLQLAQVPMNSFFMNHLLFAELRNRTHRDLWTRFEVMSQSITPDLETFVCLWECMKHQVSTFPYKEDKDIEEAEGFPNPRQLFARMLAWISKLQGQSLREAINNMDVEFYHEIIRCFCLDRDVAGTFVVMHALKTIFNVYPNGETIQMLGNQIARLNTKKPISHRHARRVSKTVEKQGVLQKTSQMLGAIADHRGKEMAERGIQLDEEQADEERQRILLQMLYSVLQHRLGEATKAEEAIREAAEEMGVEPFDIDATMELIM